MHMPISDQRSAKPVHVNVLNVWAQLGYGVHVLVEIS